MQMDGFTLSRLDVGLDDFRATLTHSYCHSRLLYDEVTPSCSR